MEHNSGLVQVLIYLSAMVITVPIFKKLGLGAVLGYLCAGIILGPHGLKLIQDSRESALHISEFGVIMMLLMIGLELNPKILWKLRMPIFGLGGLQVTLTSAIICGIGILAQFTWQSSLATGMIIAMSSTAIVLQTLQEKGLIKSSGGENSFAVLLFQDIAVIPILAILPLLATTTANHSSESPLLRFALIIGAVSTVIIFGRFLFRPFFRFIASSRIRELFTATALLLVLAITALMEKVGLSPALGAFLAGVVLADSEYRHQIESDIEPFKGILLGLFFISVGSGVDFTLVMQKPLIVLLCVMTLIFIKFAIVYGLGRLGKLSMPDSLLFGVSLAQGGEFAFVLIAVVVGELHILNNEQGQLLTAIVALSMALAPLLINAYIKWGQPYFSHCNDKPERESDHIDENENSVIVVGIGRFGQGIVRLLRTSGFKSTVLDYDADQVDVLRKFGVKAYYGDGSRLDLLHAAGAAQAKIIVIAIDDQEKATELVKTVQEHFAHLKIYARAYDRLHAYDLINLGVKHVYVETAGSSFQAGSDVLVGLGFGAKRAHRTLQIFKRANESSMREIAKIYKESDKDTNFISQAKVVTEAMEKVLTSDISDERFQADHDWVRTPGEA